jgi:protoporphyrinogen IX oxidase
MTLFYLVKALHIIFIVTWFAGLFYVVRLFVYHAETEQKEEQVKQILKEQYKIMEWRLWYIIAWPSAILTLILGVTMLILNPFYMQQPWMHVKFSMVLLLFVYHLKCHSIFKNLQQDIIQWTSTQFRLWNEVATILLIAIVFTIVLRSELDWIWGVAGITLTSVIIMLAIKAYKTKREKQSDL